MVMGASICRVIGHGHERDRVPVTFVLPKFATVFKGKERSGSHEVPDVHLGIHGRVLVGGRCSGRDLVVGFLAFMQVRAGRVLVGPIQAHHRGQEDVQGPLHQQGTAPWESC